MYIAIILCSVWQWSEYSAFFSRGTPNDHSIEHFDNMKQAAYAENRYHFEIDANWKSHRKCLGRTVCVCMCRNIGNFFGILDNRSWTWNQFDVWLVLWMSNREVTFRITAYCSFLHMNDSRNKSDKLNESQVKTFSLNYIARWQNFPLSRPKACQQCENNKKKLVLNLQNP